MFLALEFIANPITTDEALFIQSHLKSDIPQLLLTKNYSYRERLLLEQAFYRQHIEKKLPFILSEKKFILPQKLNLEQSSSEKSARFKATIIQGKTLLDLTLGMGIDFYFISRNFDTAQGIELNSDLALLTEFNLKVAMQCQNISILGGIDARSFIEDFANEYVDVIYMDPARRNEKGGKTFLLEDCTPNVKLLLPQLSKRCSHLWIKSSPVLDIKRAIQELIHVKDCYVIEAENECKELLFHIDFSFLDETTIHVIRLDNNQQFSSKYSTENDTEVSYSYPKKYIYEPSPSTLKSGLYKQISQLFNVEKLHPNSHLYTSDMNIKTFPGRAFECVGSTKPNFKDLKTILPHLQANLGIRNYPGNTKELTKKLKLRDGGNDYIFATTLLNEEKILLVCKKTTHSSSLNNSTQLLH